MLHVSAIIHLYLMKTYIYIYSLNIFLFRSNGPKRPYWSKVEYTDIFHGASTHTGWETFSSQSHGRAPYPGCTRTVWF